MKFSRSLNILAFLGLIAVIFYDSYFHFDAQRVSEKRQAGSAQHHWNIHYPQQYTYSESSFKYQDDINEIRGIIDPGKLLLSDKATSYYLAAELPVYVKNLHAHHSRGSTWARFLQMRYACYIDLEPQFNEVLKFIENHRNKASDGGEPEFKYWVFNSDSENINLRNDCLAARGSGITPALTKLAKQLYKGEYLWLYELN